MKRLLAALVMWVVVTTPGSSQTQAPKDGQVKKLALTSAIQTELDSLANRTPYYVERLPESSRTLDTAYTYLKKERFKDFLAPDKTVYGVEAMIDKEGARRKVLVYSDTPDFTGTLVYADSKPRHYPQSEWLVFVRTKFQGDSPFKVELRGTLKSRVGSTFFLEFNPRPRSFRLLTDVQVDFGGDKGLLERAEKLLGKTVLVTGVVVETGPTRGFPKKWELILVVRPSGLEEVKAK